MLHGKLIKVNFNYLGTEDEVFAKIFNKETGQKEQVNDRNMLRENLLSSFESISVSIFSTPGENLRDLDPNATSKEFKKCLKLLKNKIGDQMSQPQKFGKTILKSQNVDVLMRKFIQSLEESGMVHLQSALTQYDREVIDEAKRRFEESLRNAYKEVVVPVRDGLEEQLTQKRDALLYTFINSTDNIDMGAAYRDEMLQNLKKFAEHEIEVKKREN